MKEKLNSIAKMLTIRVLLILVVPFVLLERLWYNAASLWKSSSYFADLKYDFCVAWKGIWNAAGRCK